MSNANAANVVNGKLILSFPEAETPVVWQMDLQKAESCALEIKEDKKSKLFSLVQKISDDQQNTIASFKEKSDAVAALMATSSALQRGEGNVVQFAHPLPQQIIHPAGVQTVQYVTTSPSAKKEGKKAFILSFVLILILLLVWAVSVPLGRIKTDQLSSSTGGGAPVESGQAVSADEFLKSR